MKPLLLILIAGLGSASAGEMSIRQKCKMLVACQNRTQYESWGHEPSLWMTNGSVKTCEQWWFSSGWLGMSAKQPKDCGSAWLRKVDFALIEKNRPIIPVHQIDGAVRYER